MDNKAGKNLGHEPVLLDEAIAALRPEAGGLHVDATFGGGGYTRGILQRAPAARVVAVDRDPEAVARGRALAVGEPGLTMVEGRFGDLAALLAGIGIERVDGIVADVGLSSYQLDARDRGFAFAEDGPLDMRMGPDGPTAAELLATLDEAELARVLRDYGDEPHARRIARLIVDRRAREPITRTRQLRELVHRAKRGGHGPRDPATQTFQALRIAVNDELGELERLLEAAAEVLIAGRPPRRRELPLGRGPHRQASRRAARRPGAGALAPSAARRAAASPLRLGAARHHPPQRRRGGAQPACPIGAPQGGAAAARRGGSGGRRCVEARRMISRTSIVAGFCAMLAAMLVFHLKYKVLGLERELTSVQKDVVSETWRLRTLRAELAYLSRPERLAMQAKQLGLHPAGAEALTSVPEIAKLYDRSLSGLSLAVVLPSGNQVQLAVKPRPPAVPPAEEARP